MSTLLASKYCIISPCEVPSDRENLPMFSKPAAEKTLTCSPLFFFSSEAEKNKWFHDLKSAIENIKANSDEHRNQYTSTLKSNGKVSPCRKFFLHRLDFSSFKHHQRISITQWWVQWMTSIPILSNVRVFNTVRTPRCMCVGIGISQCR